MSAGEAAESAALADLKAALGTRDALRATAAELHRAANEKRAEIKARETELNLLERAQEDAAVATALGDNVVDEVLDDAVIEQARVAARVAARVSAAFDDRLSEANSAVTPAERAVRVAAQRYFKLKAFDPAHKAFADAFETLRVAANSLMAAHNLAFWEYADRKEYRISEGGPFGPAEDVFRKLVGPWGVLPYDIQPAFLTYAKYKRPFDSPEVKANVAQLKSRLKEDLAS